MKTKIIYISGNEVFDMNDIRAAFEEVRVALNLDKTTVLFGVPVDEDDTGLMTKEKTDNAQIEPVIDNTYTETKKITEPVIDETIPTPINEEIIEEITETVEEPVEEIIDKEPVIADQPKKRGRPRKETVTEEVTEQTSESIKESETSENKEEKIVPILSVLSTKDDSTESGQTTEEIEIIPEIPEDTKQETFVEETSDETIDEDEADLEKLLSAMTPLQEDILEDKKTSEIIDEPVDENEDISVDATLEQLATEFVETQDKIATENKSSSRSKIGKLRNILPFKQSKHKDQGLGDLFGWAGIAANDEDFSVPGFFTNAASKK